MKRIIKFIVHHILAISPELGIRVKWFHFFKEQINLKQPKLLEEKVNWLKLHELPYKEIYTQCADKYLVREYVKANSLGYLLNDLVRVYDRAEDIKLDELPDSFAMKWNFGNGMNFICPDKSKVNEVSLIRKFKQWGGGNAYIKSLEPQYRYIDKKIIVEKFLDSRSDVGLTDYKIYCFHGEPKVVLTCLDRISGDTKFYNYDLDWNSLDHFNSKQEEHNVPRPEFFTEMLEAARKLATPFPFVRVDFYEVPDRGIVFGELTFTPAGGFDWEKPRPFQEYLGQFLNLEKV